MVAKYLSFMVSGMIAGKTKKIDADCVFSFEVSPMTQVLPGISFAKRLRIPHYLYVQDLWPENVITVTRIKSQIAIKPIDKTVDYIYRNTDEIFATSPSFVEAICNRKNPVDRKKVHYWPQYAEDLYKPVEKTKAKTEAVKYGIPDDDSFKIIFTGNIGTAQGLQILPETAQRLKDENIKFVMVGDGRYLDEFERNIEKKNVQDKFILIPRQPSEVIPTLLCACDVAFLSFQDDQLWAKTIPAKLQTYMACGMPIIAATKGGTERILKEADCGICVSSGDIDGLTEAMKFIVEDKHNVTVLGQIGIHFFLDNFSKKVFFEKLESEFEKLIVV